MSKEILFLRTEEANRVATMISTDLLVGEPSCLFLAAPRRTGKSTFLRQDLRPVLEERGDLVLYVDLWEDRKVDPAQPIISCLGEAIQKLDPKKSS